ncbi:redoxin domain-containing protein [Elizabethkingia argentiflava]|uniref:Redoxin domain-containing protein n=1 Tax=Elizabethkingia argenteiflava TaxID=2681556 RepID=A0A845PVW3_9FLAO|nr:TlpA disulfide reductase family protein [Elizabethkingia argenteiflava]NAW51293.1 redoxin domain-containing protein [Elizabethkingia argenteiflava]
MKKLLLIVLCALFIVSCSNKKTVVISGKVVGGSPLERIEIIDISGVATLPFTNFGVDAQGNFSDTLQIPKNGVYALSYGGRYGLIYLKGGEPLRLSGNAGAGFPSEFTVEGASKNNLFLKKTQESVTNYFSKIDQGIITQEEPKTLVQLRKFRTDLNSQIDQIAKSTGADPDLVKWKKGELDVNLLMFSGQYEMMHGELVHQPKFKVSKAFKDYQKELKGDEDHMIKTYAAYRNYLLSGLGQDFQAYSEKNKKEGTSTTELFINYIKTKKEYSQMVKDYLISFVATSVDLTPNQPVSEKLSKLLDDNIKNTEIKSELKKVEKAIYGLKEGSDAPSVSYLDLNGKKVSTSSFKGKPTLLMFYASWNPYVTQAVPMLKDIVNTYKTKVNIVCIGMDDTMAQFKNAATSLLKEIDCQKLYAKGGLKSEIAQKYAIYGFKLPSFMILDKDGKISSRTFLDPTDPSFKTSLDKVSGITTQQLSPQGQAGLQAGSTVQNVKEEAKAK